MPFKNIYMIGICGIAMGTLAQMLCRSGHRVSGSDENIYPPMSDMLASSGVALHKGFDAARMGRPDLVIVGNAISRGNPEVEQVLNERIPYCSMAGALYDFYLKDRDVIAVCGTHGKSTTTALLAHILQTADLSPSFFVGGVSRNTGSNFAIGSGRAFVIEGDEYDSAFFEKVPKFVFYRPSHLVLTSLEFDHADIYRDLAEIELWFRRLVNMVPSKGLISYCAEYTNLAEIARAARSRTASFGGAGADYGWEFAGYDGDFSLLKMNARGEFFPLRTRLFGDFNFANISAAVSFSLEYGVPVEAIRKGVEGFLGVKRRQEAIYSRSNTVVYEDFAHHPTAVGHMLKTLRERYPGHRLWAVYEPRSATSRRSVFQAELPAAFRPAHEVLIKTPFDQTKIPPGDRLDIGRVRDEIRVFNSGVCVLPDAESIVGRIADTLNPSKPNVIVIMSNGGFGGIYDKIRTALDRVLSRDPA